MKIGELRRIDNLGRIVIPKSIRKSLRIKSGDNIQIYIKEENIILKKYFELNKIEEILIVVKKNLEENIKTNIYITNKDKILFKNKDTEITKELLNLIEKRNIIKKQNVQITKNIKGSITISPIIVNGDIYGSILIEKDELTKEELSTVKTLTNFISKLLEE